MSIVHIDIALDESVAKALHERAASQRKAPDCYVADLIARDARREQDALAEEGYRLLSQDTRSFADGGWQLAQTSWPMWNEGEHDADTESG